MADLGVDISCVIDIDPMFRTVGGPTAVAQRHGRRFRTSTGQLLEHPLYGYDIRNLLNASGSQRTVFRLKSIIEQQMLRDEETDSVVVDVTYVESAKSLRIRAHGQTSEGPFDLVLAVTEVTVEILEAAATVI